LVRFPLRIPESRWFRGDLKRNGVLRSVDGVQGNDVAEGGPGEDTCFIDEGDEAIGCEVIFT
jgi:hypothetical protein